MSKKVKLQSICAELDGKASHIFDIKHDPYDYDCHDTCLIWDRISFYGVPEGMTDDQMEKINDGDFTNAVRIGSIFGCLILCTNMIVQGENPWLICDDEDGELEYTMSALTDEGGPLNDDTGDFFQDVYYIHEFDMKPGYDTKTLKYRILKELPKLIFAFFHVVPGVLAFYPSPLDYEKDEQGEAEDERTMTLSRIAAAKMDEYIGATLDLEEKPKNILSFSGAYRFTEDDINRVMRRRNSTSSYPEKAKNKKEWTLFEGAGFREMGGSRLLFKLVR